MKIFQLSVIKFCFVFEFKKKKVVDKLNGNE